MKTHPKREDLKLKPVGVALAAVVAGLGAAQAADVSDEARPRAPLEPLEQTNMYFVDPTNHPGFEEDPEMIVGPSAPVEPFAKR